MLRECKVCNGTDDALLKGGSENERTFLLSRWFHCVKLPVDVMEEDHPFHELFTQDPVEHLFVCAVDGSDHRPLESQTSRVELWKSMVARIEADYEKDPGRAMKDAVKLLDKFDIVDQKIFALKERRDEILEEDGPGSRKLRKILRELESEEGELRELLDRMERVSRLGLARRPAEDEEEGSQ